MTGGQVVREMGKILVEIGYTDAGHAGTEENIECTLIVTNSNAGRYAYSVGLTSMGPGASDKYGALIIKNKFINVRDKNETNKIQENLDINNLMKLLGLDYEKKYDTKDDLKTLRYGKILILADQNNYGCYFKGLLINFIHHFWPNLLKFYFIYHLVVPVVRAVKGQEVYNFYSLQEFKAWKKTTSGTQNYQAKYYRSLGELSNSEMKDHFVNLKRQIIKFTYTGEDDDESIILAFSGEMLGQRQDWIKNYLEKAKHSRDKMTISYRENTSYSEFINLDLIQVFVDEIDRTIPNVIDGLTRTERLALLACMEEVNQEEIEINELAESIARKSSYKDREELLSAIVRLTENFVGSNNINLLQLIGNSGMELSGKKVHSSVRNLRVKLNPLARLIFRLEEYIFYHNNRPVYYAPIIPMILINGADGKGKIWQTKILKYNPRDVIQNLLRMINGEEQKPMIPYYKKFKGSINHDGDNNYGIFGEISVIARDKIEISELPVGYCTTNYRKTVLDSMLSGTNDSSGMIEEYQDLSSDTNVKFIVTINPEQLEEFEQEGLYDVFKLEKKISVNSMHAFDDNLSIKYYPSVAQIMLDFFNVKQKMYENTKNYLTGLLKAEILKLSNQIRFIVQVGKNQFHNYGNENSNALINALKNHGYDPDPVTIRKNNQTKEDVLCDSLVNTGQEEDFDYLLDMSVRNFTKENKNELIKIKDEKQNKLASIESKTAIQIWRDELEELLQAFNESEKSKEIEENIHNNTNVEMELTEPERCVALKCHVELEKRMETGDTHEPLSSDNKDTESPVTPSLDLEVQSAVENSVILSENERFGTSKTPKQAAEINLPSEDSQVIDNADDSVQFSDSLTRTDQPTTIVLPNEDNYEKENHVPVVKVSGDEHEEKPKTMNRLIRSILIATDNLNLPSKKKAAKQKKSPGQTRSLQTRKSVRFDLPKENTPEQLDNSRGKNVVEEKNSSGEEEKIIETREKLSETVESILPNDNSQVQQNHLNAEKILKEKESPEKDNERPSETIKTIELEPKINDVPKNNTMIEEKKLQEIEKPRVEEKKIEKSRRSFKRRISAELILSEEASASTDTPPPRKKIKTAKHLVLKNNNENQLNLSTLDEIMEEIKLQALETPTVEEESNIKKRGRPRKLKDIVELILPETNGQVEQNNSTKETESPVKLVASIINSKIQQNNSSNIKIVEEIKSPGKEKLIVEEKKRKSRGRPRKLDSAELILPKVDSQVEQNKSNKEKSSPVKYQLPRRTIKSIKLVTPKNNSKIQQNNSRNIKIVEEIKLQEKEKLIVEEKKRKSGGRPRKLDCAESILPKIDSQVQQNSSNKKKFVEEENSPASDEPPYKKIKIAHLAVPKRNVLKINNNVKKIKLQGIPIPIVQEKRKETRGRPRKTNEKADKLILPKTDSQVQQKVVAKKKKPGKTIKFKFFVQKKIQPVQLDHSRKKEILKVKKIQRGPREVEKKVQSVLPSTNDPAQQDTPGGSEVIEEKKIERRGRPRGTTKKAVEKKNTSPKGKLRNAKVVAGLVLKNYVSQLRRNSLSKNKTDEEKKSLEKEKKSETGKVDEIKLQRITIPIVQEKKKETRGRPRKMQDNADKLILPKTDSQMQQKVVAKKKKPRQTIKFKFLLPKKIQPVHSRKKKILNVKKIQREPRKAKKKVLTALPSTNDPAQQDTPSGSEVMKEKKIERRGRPRGTPNKTMKEKNTSREEKLRNAKVVAGLVLKNYVSQLQRNPSSKNKTEEEKKSPEVEKKSEDEKVDELPNGINQVQQNPPRKNETEGKKPSRGRGRPAKLKKIKSGDELKSLVS